MNGPFCTEKERKREKEFHVLFKKNSGRNLYCASIGVRKGMVFPVSSEDPPLLVIPYKKPWVLRSYSYIMSCLTMLQQK